MFDFPKYHWNTFIYVEEKASFNRNDYYKFLDIQN